MPTCDHYLSYTEISTTNLLNRGYDAARITTLNNAVEALATPEQAMTARDAFRLDPSSLRRLSKTKSHLRQWQLLIGFGC